MGLHCLKAPTCPMTLTQEMSVCRWHTDQEKMSLESDFLVVSRRVPEGLLEAGLLSVTRVSCQGLLWGNREDTTLSPISYSLMGSKNSGQASSRVPEGPQQQRSQPSQVLLTWQ